MGVGADPETQQGRLNHATLRRICHASLNLELDKFATVKNDVAHVNKWFESSDNDYGASVYFKWTRGTSYAPVYTERVSMAYHMAAPSAKLCFLAKICYQVCRVEKRKLLIFSDWPVTLWMTAGKPSQRVCSFHRYYQRYHLQKHCNVLRTL